MHDDAAPLTLAELLKHKEKLLQIAAAKGVALWVVLEANAAANERVTSLEKDPDATVSLVAKMPENEGGLIALGEVEALISEAIGLHINVYGQGWFSDGLTEQLLQ